jgi:hypothetical protein
MKINIPNVKYCIKNCIYGNQGQREENVVKNFESNSNIKKRLHKAAPSRNIYL